MKAELVDLVIRNDHFFLRGAGDLYVPLSELDKFSPADKTSFSFRVDLYITEAGDTSGADDTFSFRLLTPDVLYKASSSLGKTFTARHHVFMTEWDPDGLLTLIGEVLKDAEGETWYDLATKIGEVFLWEFEGLPRPST